MVIGSDSPRIRIIFYCLKLQMCYRLVSVVSDDVGHCSGGIFFYLLKYSFYLH
jgi:hypothetical protein